MKSPASWQSVESRLGEQLACSCGFYEGGKVKRSMVLSLMMWSAGVIGLASLALSSNLLFCGPAAAQASQDGSAAAGRQRHWAPPTGYQSEQDTNLVPAAPQGQSWATNRQTQGFGGMGPNLGNVSTGELSLSPDSVNQAPLPSGAFSYGFSAGADSTTSDPYVPQGLPLTSTSSMDLNTADCDYCGQGLTGPWGW